MPVSYGILIPICVILAIVISSVKVLKENQRIVIMRLGKYLGIRGPGVIFTLGPLDRCLCLTLGESVRVLDDNQAILRNLKFPVQATNQVTPDQLAVVRGFEKSQIQIEGVSEQASEALLLPPGQASPIEPSRVSTGLLFALILGVLGFMVGLYGPVLFGLPYPQIPMGAIVASCLGVAFGFSKGRRLDSEHSGVLSKTAWLLLGAIMVCVCALIIGSPLLFKI